MNSINAYFQQLGSACADQWNRFWFTARDAYTVCVMRILVGIAAFYYVASFSPDLVRWFGPSGILNAATTGRLTGADQLAPSFRISYIYFAETPTSLWVLHIAGLVVLLVFTLGLWSRAANIGALIVVLAYVHRGPMLTGQFEPVLTMLLAYLCLANTGHCLSIDAWRRRRKGRVRGTPAVDGIATSIVTNIATRLIQLHLAGLCVTIGLNMLAGEVWWSGEAMWWLITRTESRLVDFTGLARATLLVNLWTHGVVAFQLVFGVLVWNRLARPLLLVLSIVVWGSLGLATGLVAWCVLMLVANLAFVEPMLLRQLLERRESGVESPESKGQS